MNIRKRLEKLEAGLPATPALPPPAAGMTPGQLAQLPAGDLLRMYRQALGGAATLSPAARQEYDRLAKLPVEELRRLYAEMLGQPDLAGAAP